MESEIELVKTCKQGQPASVRQRLDKILKKAGKERKPILMKATEERQGELVSLLLQRGANPNVVDPTLGDSPLHVALRTHQNDVATAILRYDVDVNVPNNKGLLPLHQAAHDRDDDLVRKLILKGTDVNIGNSNAQTPLMIVCQIGCISLAMILLQNGADLGARDSNGWSALEYAILAGIYRELRSLFPEGFTVESLSGRRNENMCKICNHRVPLFTCSEDALSGILAGDEDLLPVDSLRVSFQEPMPETHVDCCGSKSGGTSNRPFDLLDRRHCCGMPKIKDINIMPEKKDSFASKSSEPY